MFSRLFSKTKPLPSARTPEETVVWAVGDIHGRSDLSAPLIDAIRADLVASAASRKVIVFLGDHVDRGPDSRGVLDQLVEVGSDTRLEVHCLRGNHEERLEAFLDEPDLGPSWCDYGGREALMSYGVVPPVMKGDADGWVAASVALGEALPDSHRRLLRSQAYCVSIGDYFFAHAGARPGVPLEAQSPEDLMWIRQAFLDHPAPFEQVVVHGHTPSETVVWDGRRIGVDTGAYATNVLSAVRLEGETRTALQAAGRGERVTLSTSALAG
ncbi:MAG: serine/threonine protein phosphatase [Brevundimonas subvibrioides]|uniref:Serine/threonine protein phosphatase n=1 Tax=Brevundimonas subvibrioides TaxID=74313 RepID=A0A258FRN4_9CAUL|nr:MAG: serine/threonine protein phosphatase [Brevundimonas subvibrioides]